MTRFLTLEEAAVRVERGESTIRRWIDKGLMSVAGRIPEQSLLEFEKKMRSRRGRPKTVKPRKVVLGDVVAERDRQDAKWGQQNHPDGTGRAHRPLDAIASQSSYFHATNRFGDADDLAAAAKRATDVAAGDGRVTWADILLEEVFEALAESDPVELRAELIQVAAVATQWAEAIDRRSPDSGSDS
mgnify:CR=1 FL=1